MSGKYLNIDSTYRNRIKYPNAFDFVVSINDVENSSLNFVSKQSIVYPTPSFPEADFTLVQTKPSILQGVESDLLQIEPIYNTSIVDIPTFDSIIRSNGIFNNKYIQVINDNRFFINDESQYTILDLPISTAKICQTIYDKNGRTLEGGEITTSDTFSLGLSMSANVYGNTNQYVYLSLESSEIDNFYVGKKINVTSNAAGNPIFTRTITSYDGLRRVATLDLGLPFIPYLNMPYSITTEEAWFLELEEKVSPYIGNDGVLRLIPTIPGGVTPDNTYPEFIYPNHIQNNMLLFKGFTDWSQQTYFRRHQLRIRDGIPVQSGKITTLNSNINQITLNDTSLIRPGMWIQITNKTQIIEEGYVHSLDSAWDTPNADSYKDFDNTLGINIWTLNEYSEDYLVGMKIQMYTIFNGDFFPSRGYFGGEITSSESTTFTTNLFDQSTIDVNTNSVGESVDWRNVIWVSSLELFIAIGSDSNVMTSQNGITWEEGTVDTDSLELLFITWNENDDFGLILSEDGQILKSTNGKEWELETTLISRVWSGIEYVDSLDLFVACNNSFSDTDSIAVSSDGTSWTYTGIAFVFGILGVGTDGNIAWVANYDSFYYSLDGLNWNLSGGTAYGVGYSGFYYSYSPTLSRLITSNSYSNDGGITWFSRSDAFDAQIGTWISKRQIFIEYESFASNVHWSADGISWTTGNTLTSYPNDLTSLAYSPELDMVVTVRLSNSVMPSPVSFINNIGANPTLVKIKGGLPINVLGFDTLEISTYYISRENPNFKQYYLITHVDGNTISLSGDLNENVRINDTFDILNVETEQVFPLDYYRILEYERCYSIELESITLPNQILNVGIGNLLSSYPYIYVEFEMINGSYRNIFLTNNNNARKATFKIPMYNVKNPLTTPFVRLNGQGMKQVIKFNRNDSIRLRVFLPNGETLRMEPDTTIPNPPNQKSQVSYLFYIKPV